MTSQGAALGSQCCSLSWTANAVSLKPDQYSGIPLGPLFLFIFLFLQQMPIYLWTESLFLAL